MSLAQPVIVRPARLSDALAIATVHHAAVHELAAGFYPADVLAQWSPPVTLARAPQILTGRFMAGSAAAL